MRKTFALLAALLLASGCTRIRLLDDIDLTFDFTPLLGPSNLLHQPYVVGSDMNIFVDHTDNKKDLTGWSLRSSDEAIFVVDAPSFSRFDKDDFSVHCHAVGPGTAQLEVLDEHGHVKHRTSVEVALPTRVDFLAHGPLLVEHPSLDPLTPEPRVLAGGTATFLVRYYDQNELLYGNGALIAASTSDVSATTPETWLFEDRDWLQITPHQAGDTTLPLQVGTHSIPSLTIHAVPQTDITEIRILGENESRAHKGEWLVALAQAYDAQARPIFGVEYDWELDGNAELGEGDLYRYEYDPKQKRSLEAHNGPLDAVATIHGEDGFVDSSNRIGCRIVTASASLGQLLLLGAAVALARRRRRP